MRKGVTLLGAEWKSDPEIIGEKIKAARKKAKLTQEQLAEEIGGGCTNKVISRYENGRVEMGVQALWDIAESLEVPVNDLVPDRLQVHRADENQQELDSIFTELSEEKKTQLLQMARWLRFEENKKAIWLAWFSGYVSLFLCLQTVQL